LDKPEPAGITSCHKPDIIGPLTFQSRQRPCSGSISLCSRAGVPRCAG
jgi:hypothetical protein